RSIVQFDRVRDAWNVYPLPKGFQRCGNLFKDRRGLLWISDGAGRIATYDPVKGVWGRTIDLANHWPQVDRNAFVSSSMVEDKRGILIVGTSCGLLSLDRESNAWEAFDETNSALPDHHITHVAQDPDGTIWLTFCSGIAELAP